MRDDEGSALVEFTYLSVLLMVPLVYVLLSVFAVQRAAFGTTEAARQAGRAFVTADDVRTAQRRGSAAAELVLRDQGVELVRDVRFDCLGGPCLAPGSRVRVTVRYDVHLPFTGLLFGRSSHGAIPVRAQHTAYVDRFVER